MANMSSLPNTLEAASSPSLSISILAIPSSLAIPLRHSVLWPSKPPSFVLLKEDDLPTTIHLGVFVLQQPPPPPAPNELNSSQEAVELNLLPSSILTLVPEPFPSPSPLSDFKALRFRKFATDPSLRGRGLGARLLENVWARAQEDGVELVWCDARAETRGWYERRGMRIEGVGFEKDGKAYVRVVKEILFP